MAMADFEKLGVFYLGREYDPSTRQARPELLLYDARDLVTHAVCVGMTGSGKTGLCIALLEEAAIDGIPALVIDPKGDLGNLLLTFPELRGEDFLPWVNEEDARRKGASTQEYAEQQATLWRDGLARWGQDGERIRRLRAAADFTIYTPGSTAGLPLSILSSFAAPGPAIVGDPELLAERAAATVTGLLALLGIEADPLQSREHILLASILQEAWRAGRDLDLAGLIHAIQTPPIERIGVFDLESFYPAKERFGLAMRVNSLLAAPGFATWLEGEPLDVGRLLYTASGQPRVAIVSIAHLGDAERMFVVSLLLTQLLGWMRAQPGTTSLRALFYMDEIFGYFPPVANPPAKAPLLTLLKQARAYGLGIVLATQNPVDLDYKGLANAGTWFIGRLQTERDCERVLDGLAGAAAGGAGRFDRAKMSALLAGLGQRVFLLSNVHDDAPVVFETRWVMSYLRGPLTREQIRQLTGERRPASRSPQAPAAAPGGTAPAEPTGVRAVPQVPSVAPVQPRGPAPGSPPALPPEIPQVFLPRPKDAPPGRTLVYEPMLIAAGRLFFANAQAGIATQKNATRLVPFCPGPSPVGWDEGREVGVELAELERFPHEGALFADVPHEAAIARSYGAWTAAFKDWLYRNEKLRVWKSPTAKLLSSPGESERDFRIRLQQSLREQRDALMGRLREKYSARIATLEGRIQRAQSAVHREQEQAEQQRVQAAISLGATLLSAFGGRRALGRSTLGRATTTARGAGRMMKEQGDIARAEQDLTALQAQLAALRGELEAEAARLAGGDLQAEALQSIELRPRKTDIAVELLALAWVPAWRD
jgi:hypothetical protein